MGQIIPKENRNENGPEAILTLTQATQKQDDEEGEKPKEQKQEEKTGRVGEGEKEQG